MRLCTNPQQPGKGGGALRHMQKMCSALAQIKKNRVKFHVIPPVTREMGTASGDPLLEMPHFAPSIKPIVCDSVHNTRRDVRADGGQKTRCTADGIP